jgi:hypothetical protein
MIRGKFIGADGQGIVGKVGLGTRPTGEEAKETNPFGHWKRSNERE